MDVTPTIPIAKSPDETPSAIVAKTGPDAQRTAGDAPQTSKCHERFVAGEKDDLGQEITELLYTGPKCVVFIRSGPGLGWHVHDELCIDPETSITEASDLINELKATISDSAAVLRGVRLVGACLARALNQRTANNTTAYFEAARDFVVIRRRETLQIHYLVAAILAALVIGSLASVAAGLIWRASAYAQGDGGLFCTAVAAGAAGALVSVSQRFRSIPIERYASLKYTAIGGVSRILFGAIFGAGVLLLQRAGLLLAIADGRLYLLATAAVAAGFSERLFPELLQRFESQLNSSDKREKAQTSEANADEQL